MRKLNKNWCKLTILMSLLSFVGCSPVGTDEGSSSEFPPKIIGGDVANEGRYPYTVSLQDNIGHFCGGSLIAKDIVLTAAHCQGGSYKAVIGRYDLDRNNGDTVGVRREVPHPDYGDRTDDDNDFMLLVLNRPTRANVQPVRLNSSGSAPSNNQRVTVVGWGDTHPGAAQELSDVLMTVNVNTISNQQCRNSSGYIDGYYDTYKNDILDSMLCARANNKDSCQGDSGGPLVIPGNRQNGSNDRQVGVVSWGIGCAERDFPGVYARVSSAYDWIREEVCKRSSNPPASFQCGNNNNNDTQQTCANGTANVRIEIMTDNAGWETSWELKSGNTVIDYGPPDGRNYGRDQRYIGMVPVCRGQNYTIVVKDNPYGDGMCCEYGNGYFKVSVDGKQKAYFSEFNSKEVSKRFFVGN